MAAAGRAPGYGAAVVRLRPPRLAIALAMSLPFGALACAGEAPRVAAPSTTTATPASPTQPTPTAVTSTQPTPTTPTPTTTSAPSTVPAPTRPTWLGERPLPTDSRGFGRVLPTPPELVVRRFPTPDLLPPPPDDQFHAVVTAVPDAVLSRSTWSAGCPVTVDDLRYVTVSFWGFDDRPHTGELLVNADVAEDVVSVFRRLHEARFPIEEVRVTRADELDAAPTGDGNNTSAFVCRAVRGSSTWSQHAFGRAIDLNPFHNPYRKGDLVLPELASAYLDRDRVRPGMILPGDIVTSAFADLGWDWGGSWRTLEDHQHFSRDGG